MKKKICPFEIIFQKLTQPRRAKSTVISSFILRISRFECSALIAQSIFRTLSYALKCLISITIRSENLLVDLSETSSTDDRFNFKS
uniref:Ovule protein n=1 Tax=Caenorhabditis tropicalis TaxID=1561998 RepID=A0A1I7T2E2_9PELO